MASMNCILGMFAGCIISGVAMFIIAYRIGYWRGKIDALKDDTLP